MKNFISSLFIFFTFISFSQDNGWVGSSVQLEEDNIEQVIDTLFTGIKLGDSSMVSSVFHHDSRIQTIYSNKQNEPDLFEEKIITFLVAIGTPHEQVWNEQISNLIILVDDNLASVWMDYSFYIDKDFSHCGVNAMQLIKTTSGWKILSIIDTRRKENCNK